MHGAEGFLLSQITRFRPRCVGWRLYYQCCRKIVHGSSHCFLLLPNCKVGSVRWPQRIGVHYERVWSGAPTAADFKREKLKKNAKLAKISRRFYCAKYGLSNYRCIFPIYLKNFSQNYNKRFIGIIYNRLFFTDAVKRTQMWPSDIKPIKANIYFVLVTI